MVPLVSPIQSIPQKYFQETDDDHLLR